MVTTLCKKEHPESSQSLRSDILTVVGRRSELHRVEKAWRQRLVLSERLPYDCNWQPRPCFSDVMQNFFRRHN